MASSRKHLQAQKAGRGGPALEPKLDALGPDDEGALRIGATDLGMVRLILATRSGVVELDYPPDDAREIAEEILAAAARSEGSPNKAGKRKD